MDAHRAFCWKEHRIIGFYLATTAWARQLDCVVLERLDLESMLGLQRFKSARIQWLEEDLQPWFPHQVPFYHTGALSSIHSLFLSRVPIAEHLQRGEMTTEARIQCITDSGPRTETLMRKTLAEKRPTQEMITKYLALLAGGLIDPTRIPSTV